MNSVSVYIIVYNEADKITAAINSVLWADEIVVADSYSTDSTAAIAESMGARVVQIPFEGFGALRNAAVAFCVNNWIFNLDADERCTPEVRDEILQLIHSDSARDAYYVPRKNFFMGKWIKHSGLYPDYRQPQLFRKGALSYKTDLVHEGIIFQTGKKPGYLRNAVHQIPYKDFSEILHKIDRYSSLGAKRMADSGKKSGMTKAFLHAAWAFFYPYFLKFGFLDGWPGFALALGSFEGTFYKYAKRCEMDSNWGVLDSRPIDKT